MIRNQPRDPAKIVIFGASGDLTRRKLIPAFYSLFQNGLMPAEFQVLGVARSQMSDQEFRDHLFEGVKEFGRLKPDSQETWDQFSERLRYLAGGYDDPQTHRKIAAALEESDQDASGGDNRLYYLSIPPTLYVPVIEQLGDSGLNRNKNGWCRIIIEKPFGRDLKTAHQLNELVHTYFDEDQIYRIDHYLGKETVQNIMSFRFANSIFEPVWNRRYVDHVQISVLESVGVGHRGGYYDRAGVLRDMFQNHLLQLVSLTAMEPPIDFNAKALRDEKVKVLQAVPSVPWEDVVFGQYEGYRQNPGVGEESTTPTYAAVRLYVNTWRWQGVPFYLRSAKNLAEKSSEITLTFKDVPHQLFQEDSDPSPNSLSLCIQPDEGMHLRFQTKIPGAGMRTDPVQMHFHYDTRFGEHGLPDAYERLLLDALQGDASLFARSDEIEQAWSIIDPLINGWEKLSNPPLAYYRPGTWGPIESDEFLAQDDRKWDLCCSHDD